MKRWTTKKLGELIAIEKGKKAPKVLAAPTTMSVRYLQIEDLRADANLKYCEPFDCPRATKSDVIIAWDGANAGTVSCNLEGCIGSTLAILRPTPTNLLSALFLSRLLQSNFDYLQKTATGATIPHVSKEALNALQIPLPPLPEQRRIVGILDEAFEGIATAKANAEKNLQNARAVFGSHLNAVFTQRGEGWVEKKLSEACAITSTLVDPRKKKFLDLNHVGAGNIESKTGVFVDLKTAREECLISGKFLFNESMVLYSKIRPYLMKVARPDFGGLCSADMYPLVPLPNQITRDYLFHLLLSKRFTDYAIQGSARAGMPKVNRKHLFEFTVWLPEVTKQKELASKLDELRQETQRLESIYQQKLAALEELKKSLLHQAFTGEL